MSDQAERHITQFQKRRLEIKGRLSRPIERSENPSEQERIAITKELNERTELLFERHGIKHGDWETLAMTLAFLHEPGFRFKKQAGAKEKWNLDAVTRFCRDVDAIMSGNKHLSRIDAGRIVARREQWRNLFSSRRASDPTDAAIQKVLQKYPALIASEDARQLKAARDGYRMLFGELPEGLGDQSPDE